MANPSIRGHQAQFRIYANGALVNIIHFTSVDVNQESQFHKTYYTGSALPEGDQSMEGWSGSVELQVKDSSVDDFIDALTTNNLNGIGISDYAFLVTEFYADGTQAAWAYGDCQWKMGRKSAGLNEKVTKRLEFQAMTRKKL